MPRGGRADEGNNRNNIYQDKRQEQKKHIIDAGSSAACQVGTDLCEVPNSGEAIVDLGNSHTEKRREKSWRRNQREFTQSSSGIRNP